MSRRRAREFTLQMLFQADLAGGSPQQIRRIFWELHPAALEIRKFSDHLFLQALENQDTIDGLISQSAKRWRLDRMAAVDRNVLRLAIAEFLYTKTPRVVVIDEAVEIARRYGSEKSAEFVNGILDAIREELEKSPV